MRGAGRRSRPALRPTSTQGRHGGRRSTRGSTLAPPREHEAPEEGADRAWALRAAAALSVLISARIIIALLGKAIAFLAKVPLDALWTTGWYPRQNQFDLPTIFIGTLAHRVHRDGGRGPARSGGRDLPLRVRDPAAPPDLKPIIETLAGMPSVVLGYFALSVISPDLVKKLFSSAGSSTSAAGIAVGILTSRWWRPSPRTRCTRSRVRSEAAYGIGARRRSVTTKVVFPAAVSGIVAALILGISRAMGETMVVAIAAGGTGGRSDFNLLRPGQTMTGRHLVARGRVGPGRGVPADAQSLRVALFVGLLLFVLTFTLNLVSERFVRRVRKHY